MGKAIFTVFDNSMYLPSINYSIEKVVKIVPYCPKNFLYYQKSNNKW